MIIGKIIKTKNISINTKQLNSNIKRLTYQVNNA